MPSKGAAFRVGWDANVLLSYVDGATDRLPDIDALLDQARRKEIEIITSTLSQVEVAFGTVERDKRALDPSVEDKIDKLWALGSPIQVVDLHTVVTRRARALIREAMTNGWRLNPRDAIHLATAVEEKAQEFHTYDTELKKYEALAGISVGPPLAGQLTLPESGARQPIKDV